jgi:hypothetical protein
MANTTRASGCRGESKGKELTSAATARHATGSGRMISFTVEPVSTTLMAHDIQASIVTDVNMARVSLYGVMGPPTTGIFIKIRSKASVLICGRLGRSTVGSGKGDSCMAVVTCSLKTAGGI